MQKDIHTGFSGAVALAAAVYSADANGATIDLQNTNGCEFFIAAGVGGITFSASNKIELVMEESEDGSTWTAVDGDVIRGAASVTDGIVKAFTAAHAAAAVYRFGYVGYKPYVRMRADFSGTHGTGTPLAIVAVQRGMDNPQADQA